MLTDMHVLESGGMILLDVPAETAEATRERLDQFIFTEDVQRRIAGWQVEWRVDARAEGCVALVGAVSVESAPASLAALSRLSAAPLQFRRSARVCRAHRSTWRAGILRLPRAERANAI